MKIETTMTLFDNPKNRKKIMSGGPLEVMADDEDNGNQAFWEALDDFIQWGKKYKITIEEIP